MRPSMTAATAWRWRPRSGCSSDPTVATRSTETRALDTIALGDRRFPRTAAYRVDRPLLPPPHRSRDAPSRRPGARWRTGRRRQGAALGLSEVTVAEARRGACDPSVAAIQSEMSLWTRDALARHRALVRRERRSRSSRSPRSGGVPRRGRSRCLASTSPTSGPTILGSPPRRSTRTRPSWCGSRGGRTPGRDAGAGRARVDVGPGRARAAHPWHEAAALPGGEPAAGDLGPGPSRPGRLDALPDAGAPGTDDAQSISDRSVGPRSGRTGSRRPPTDARRDRRSSPRTRPSPCVRRPSATCRRRRPRHPGRR